MLVPHGTMIALVDGERFELYRNTGNEADPHLAPVAPPRLQGDNHSSGSRHYSSAGNPQDSLQEEDAHAAAVTTWLNSQVLAHKLDGLVVIAAPRTLGEMRKRYHKQLRAILLGEVAKDLVGRSGPEIIAALRA